MKEKSEKKPLKFNWWIFLMQCTTLWATLRMVKS